MSTSKGAGRRVGLIVGAVLILAGFGYLAYGGLGESLVYFVTPAEMRTIRRFGSADRSSRAPSCGTPRRWTCASR